MADDVATIAAGLADVNQRGWHWRRLTGDSMSVYRSDPAKMVTRRFDGYGATPAEQLADAVAKAVADSLAIGGRAGGAHD